MLVILISAGGLLCLVCACLVPYMLIRPAADAQEQEYGKLPTDREDQDGLVDDFEDEDMSEGDIELGTRKRLMSDGSDCSDASLKNLRPEEHEDADEPSYTWDSEQGLVDASEDGAVGGES